MSSNSEKKERDNQKTVESFKAFAAVSTVGLVMYKLGTRKGYTRGVKDGYIAGFNDSSRVVYDVVNAVKERL